jgi:hypothetical protein
MHIGSIQQIDEDDQREQTNDGQFWVVTGGDEKIFFFCIGQTNLYIHMDRYIPTSRSMTVARDTAMMSQMANDAQKIWWMILAQDRKRLPPRATNWPHHCPIINLW